MKKTFFFLLLTLSCWINVQSQSNTYFNVKDTFPVEAGISIIYIDSFYYATGIHYLPNQCKALFLKKVSCSGQVLKTKLIYDSNLFFWYTDPGSLIKTPDNCMVVSGGVYDTLNYVNGYLIKFDWNLDTLWMKLFPDPDGLSPAQTNGIIGSFISQVRNTIDTGQILVGTFHGYYDDNWPVWVIKTDSLGIMQWSKSFGDSTNNYVHIVESIGDSGYLIACSGLGGVASVTLLRLNIQGELLWKKYYNIPTQSSWVDFRASAITSDSCILIVSNGIYQGTGSTPVVFKISAYDGTLRWVRKYQLTDANTYGIRELNDQSILLYGKEVNADTTAFLIHYGKVGFLLKLNQNGDSLWYRKKEYVAGVGNDFHELYDLKLTPDSGFIGIGWYVLGGSQFTWLIKMDSLGCAVPNCLDTILGIKVMEQFKDVFLVVYPNPVTEQLTIGINEYHESIRELAVYDLNGRCVVRKEIHSPSHIMDVSHYKAGLYILRILTENGKWVEQKFVKEN